MTARILHREFLQQCRSVYTDGEAAAITSIIFECFTGLYKSDIIMFPERILPDTQQAKLKECLKEVLSHKPVQYITGEAWFHNLKLSVSPDVLIPRPETEQLAELVIDFIKDKTNQKILDIGTGSGCIPVAIKYFVPHCSVTAIDISEAALKIARKNAMDHRVDIEFLERDFLDMDTWKSFGALDAIVSNPPYIPFGEKETLHRNVQDHEPGMALFVDDDDPLLFYEKIVLFAKTHLAKNGQLFTEVHEKFSKQVAAYMENNGFSTCILKDIFGKDRIVTATHCQ